MSRFKDRTDAGAQLAASLAQYRDSRQNLVLGLPRGGVVVAYEVAKELNLPLDVFVVRKIGAPTQKELALGAIASGGVRVVNRELLEILDISPPEFESLLEKERTELERREALYRQGAESLSMTGKRVILVDDGLATGATMKAAVVAIRESLPEEVVVAVPVASTESQREMTVLADQMVSLLQPDPFGGVSLWYRKFPQVTDREVQDLLAQAEGRFNVR